MTSSFCPVTDDDDLSFKYEYVRSFGNNMCFLNEVSVGSGLALTTSSPPSNNKLINNTFIHS